MSPQAYFWLIVVAGFMALLSFQFNRHPHDDFNFGTGLIRCGVAGVSTTCGSVNESSR